jgi:hypothetical protein
VDAGADTGAGTDTGAGADAGADAGAGAGAGADAAPFTVIPGAAPPEGGKRWPLDGGVVAEAPPGRTFETGLALDADGDGGRDLIAWARAPDGLRGEILFVPGGPPASRSGARILAALPGGLVARGCAPRAALSQIGPTTLAFDFAPQCPPGEAHKATRWIAIVRAARAGSDGPELGLDLRVRGLTEPRDALTVDIAVADRDADGRDDLTLAFALSTEADPAPPVLRAPIVYLDRPAGLSRDASQPGEALRALAAGLLADAKRKDAAPAVAPAARALRRLHALLCEDADSAVRGAAEAAGGAAPAVTIGAGPLRCGDLGLAATLDRAEALAASTQQAR